MKCPPALRAALDALPDIDGVELLGEPRWFDRLSEWAAPVRVTLGSAAGSGIPRRTTWYVTVGTTYPWGDVSIYPARTGGIATTHPHQQLNVEFEQETPWTRGKVCVAESVAVLGRELGTEPYNADTRLAWHLRRLREWAWHASHGTLTTPGEPFELPHFEADKKVRLVFTESAESFASAWLAGPRTGTALLARVKQEPVHLLATRFDGPTGAHVMVPDLGRWVGAATDDTRIAAWIRIDRVPVQAPWRAPVTWGDLRKAVEDQGLELDTLLRQALNPFREGGRAVLILLIGFPIPRVWGGDPHQLQWQGIALEKLASKANQPHGMRPKPANFWLHDRQHTLADHKPIHWLQSENWAATELSSRGNMGSAMRDAPVAVIGCGAVGSALSELLVRGGVHRLTLIDHDDLCAGNLLRHVLTLDDVGANKATRLAARLIAATPHGDVEAIAERFPPKYVKDVTACNRAGFIVDCSADDAVAANMAAFPWNEPKSFLSFSLGADGRTLFCFGVRGRVFPLDEFRSAIRPWLAGFRKRGDMPLPREGTGCWHPVFPAPAHRVWMLTAAAVGFMDEVAPKLSDVPQVAEFVWEDDGGSFRGVRRVR